MYVHCTSTVPVFCWKIISMYKQAQAHLHTHTLFILKQTNEYRNNEIIVCNWNFWNQERSSSHHHKNEEVININNRYVHTYVLLFPHHCYLKFQCLVQLNSINMYISSLYFYNILHEINKLKYRISYSTFFRTKHTYIRLYIYADKHNNLNTRYRTDVHMDTWSDDDSIICNYLIYELKWIYWMNMGKIGEQWMKLNKQRFEFLYPITVLEYHYKYICKIWVHSFTYIM